MVLADERDDRRLRRFWSVIYVVLGGLLRRGFRLRLDPMPEPEGAAIILCNHPSMLDPLFVALSSKQQFYFLGTESLYQKGLRSRLMKYWLGPIAKQKGSVSAGAVMTMLRYLRAGRRVCIFPEGIASCNGEGNPIVESTGKLVRSAGATLITYRLEGAYLARPKWSKKNRRGPIFGVVAGVYAPEKLRAMKPREINALIHRDLFLNDYTWQRARRISYPGPRRAEGIENLLYLCPQCARIGTLRGTKNEIHCGCGLRVEIGEDAFLHGGPYSTLVDWDRAQNEAFSQRLQSEPDLVLSDEGASLYTVAEQHRPQLLLTAALRMGPHTLSVGDRSFPLDEVTGMALHGRNYFVFFHNEIHYEVKTLKTRAAYSAAKYLLMYRARSAAAGSSAGIS